MNSGTASAYGYGGAAGYREEGIAPAGLSTAYALEKVGERYYDQAFGAFLTRDTDLTQKPYAYCNGDPVNNCDPSGHLSIVNIGSQGGGAANTEGTGGAADGYGQGEEDASSYSTGSTTTSGNPPVTSTTVPVSQGSVTASTANGGTISGTDGSTTVSVAGLETSDPTVSGVMKITLGNGFDFSGGESIPIGAGITSSTVTLKYSQGGFTGGLSFSSNGGLGGTLYYQHEF